MLLTALINLINFLLSGLGAILSLIFSLLPDSPFNLLLDSPLGSYLPTLNYFIPISEIVTLGSTWLGAVGIYYLYQIGLRWIKAIE